MGVLSNLLSSADNNVCHIEEALKITFGLSTIQLFKSEISLFSLASSYVLVRTKALELLTQLVNNRPV